MSTQQPAATRPNGGNTFSRRDSPFQSRHLFAAICAAIEKWGPWKIRAVPNTATAAVVMPVHQNVIRQASRTSAELRCHMPVHKIAAVANRNKPYKPNKSIDQHGQGSVSATSFLFAGQEARFYHVATDTTGQDEAPQIAQKTQAAVRRSRLRGGPRREPRTATAQSWKSWRQSIAGPPMPNRSHCLRSCHSSEKLLLRIISLTSQAIIAAGTIQRMKSRQLSSSVKS